jgi:hypothetical protein
MLPIPSDYDPPRTLKCLESSPPIESRPGHLLRPPFPWPLTNLSVGKTLAAWITLDYLLGWSGQGGRGGNQGISQLAEALVEDPTSKTRKPLKSSEAMSRPRPI